MYGKRNPQTSILPSPSAKALVLGEDGCWCTVSLSNRFQDRLTPIICGYVANLIKKYIPDKNLLQALGQFAQAAVVIAEKAGVTDKLLDKKQFAIDKLQDMLQQAGFSKQDEELLGNCIEHAYCELKNDIESVYKTPVVSDVKPVSEKPKRGLLK